MSNQTEGKEIDEEIKALKAMDQIIYELLPSARERCLTWLTHRVRILNLSDEQRLIEKEFALKQALNRSFELQKEVDRLKLKIEKGRSNDTNS